MRSINSLLFVVIASSCAPANPDVSGGQRLAFVGASVIDVESGELWADQTVLTDGSRIVEVGSSAEVAVPTNARTIDGRGKFLIPGLWDAHAHPTHFGESVLPVFLSHGVTAIRDAGARASAFERLDGVAAGTTRPRMWSSGPMLVEGNQEDFQADLGTWSEAVVAQESSDGMSDAVQQLAGSGVDFIKIQDSWMSRDLWVAVAGEARRLDLPLAGHAPLGFPLTEAIEMGQSVVEHTLDLPFALIANERELRATIMSEPIETRWELQLAAQADALGVVDSTKLDGLAALMRERGVALIPTLTDSRAMATAATGRWSEDPRLALVNADLMEGMWQWAVTDSASQPGLMRLYEQIPVVVAFLHEAGVIVLAGTDAGAAFDFPGSDLHSELWHLVEAGLSPLDALRAASIHPARFMGVADSLGSIRRGKLADMVLLDANPLDDIGNTERIHAVVVNGEYLDRSTLDAYLDAATAPGR